MYYITTVVVLVAVVVGWWCLLQCGGGDGIDGGCGVGQWWQSLWCLWQQCCGIFGVGGCGGYGVVLGGVDRGGVCGRSDGCGHVMAVITVVVEQGRWWEWSSGCGGHVSGSDGSGSCGNTNILTLMKYHRTRNEKLDQLVVKRI